MSSALGGGTMVDAVRGPRAAGQWLRRDCNLPHLRGTHRRFLSAAGGYNPRGMARQRIHLSGAQWVEIAAHLEACLPEEGCGLLAGCADRVDLVLPIENVEHSPVHYTMEPRALVVAFGRHEALGLDLLGAFHSHPGGPFGVSQSDVREWRYPEAALVVCAPGEEGWAARAFLVDEGRVTEMPLQIEGD